MKIGLIDVDGHNFPNLPLMKISAWHKKNGDEVKWYDSMFDGYPSPPLDRVYLSKVFTHTPDYEDCVNAHEEVIGGTGYYYPKGGQPLLEEIEHTYPDYSLYPELTKGKAYGFLTRGCPRDCGFCCVGKKEGYQSHKVADLSEFWKGQKNIVLLDPNITACPDWQELFQQLIDSKAWIDFTQGLDIRLMDEEKAKMIAKMKINHIHFAWDRYRDKDTVIEKLEDFKRIIGLDERKMTVYVLTNYDSDHLEDLGRIYMIKMLGYTPYVMVYNKGLLPERHVTKQLQRWVNNKQIFRSVQRFKDYIDKYTNKQE